MREYDDLLPERFHSDALLRIVFYSFMAIEDHNRPALFRHFERLLARLGLARTTGIMQQFSPKPRTPLSDEESVLIGAAKIEMIWDDFLSRYARSCSNGDESIFCFTCSWYSYSYQSLASELYPKFNMLYGEYCGTRELPASVVYSAVRDFEERNWFKYTPSTIYVMHNLFPAEASLFENEPLVWLDDSSFSLAHRTHENHVSACLHQISRTSNVSLEMLEEALRSIKNFGGTVHRIRLISPFLCTVQFSCPNAQINQDAFSSSWKIEALQ